MFVLKKRKSWIGTIVLLILIGLTFLAFFRGQDVGELVETMKNEDPVYITYAVLAVIAFLFGQGIIYRFMLSVLGQKTNLHKCVGYSFKGYFFCSVTPFQIGGPPAQIVLMSKDNVPMPVASMLVLIVATVYKVVLIILGFGIIIFGQWFIRDYFTTSSVVMMGVGLFMTCGFCWILYMFMFHPRLAKKAIFKFFRWMERRGFMKHKDGREEGIEMGMSRYTQTADFFKSHKGTMVILFLLTVLQRLCLFSVTYFVYRAFGLQGESFTKIVILQATVSLCVDMLPIPGGVGISEALFANLFSTVFPAAFLLPALVLSRGISYYVQLLLCAGYIFIARYAFAGRRRKAEENAEQT